LQAAAAAVDGECDAEAPVATDPLMAKAQRFDPVNKRVFFFFECYGDANWTLRRELDLLETGAKILDMAVPKKKFDWDPGARQEL
jgi:hypothetical protein